MVFSNKKQLNFACKTNKFSIYMHFSCYFVMAKIHFNFSSVEKLLARILMLFNPYPAGTGILSD